MSSAINCGYEALCFVLSDITWQNNFVAVEIEETVGKRIQKKRITLMPISPSEILKHWSAETAHVVRTRNPLYVSKVKG